VHGWFGRRRVRDLPLKGYFGFSALDRPGSRRRPPAPPDGGFEDMRSWLRKTTLNPYVLVEIMV
jgi:hypothetical protein